MPISHKELLTNVPIGDVILQEDNPRLNEATIIPLAMSLLRFGLVKDNVGVDEEMKVWYGDTTTRAIKFINDNPDYFKNGIDKGMNEKYTPLYDNWMSKWAGTIPEVTRFSGLTLEEKMEYRIADNKIPETSGWDVRKLKPQLVQFMESGRDLKDTSMTPTELNLILQDKIKSLQTSQEDINTDMEGMKKKCVKTPIENYESDGSIVDPEKRDLIQDLGHGNGDMTDNTLLTPFDDPYVVHLAFPSHAYALEWLGEHGLEDIKFDENRRMVAVDMGKYYGRMPEATDEEVNPLGFPDEGEGQEYHDTGD